MAFFDNLIDKLFPGRHQNKPVEVTEPLVRSPAYLEKYQQWKNSSEASQLIKEVERSFYLKKNQIKGDFELHLFNSPAANGFALSYHPDISEQEFQYLLDYWRDRTMELNYRLANTDRQMREKGSYVQTTEKHYLKPPISKNKAKTEQRYGNILLEYVAINQQASYLKLMVTIYSDHLFTKAEPFDELVDHLFSRD